MKTTFRFILAAIGSLLMSAVVSAGQINNTKHDLSGTNSNDGGNVCIYCHVPHNANHVKVPPWNRAMPTGPFTMYTSPTIDMATANSPQGSTLACLSCHDGTIAVDQLYGDPWGSDGTNTVGGSMLIGTDLSDDHPVSIRYDATADGDFVAASGSPATVGGLPLSANNNVECSSCHSVHDDSISPFLRKSNADNSLCLSCHIK